MLETLRLPDRERKLGDFGFAGDDHVVPFEVGPLDMRGRIVQLGPLLDSILERHAYPDPVARLLAEACVVAVLLGASLKFEGKFILQTRTDGPVDMLVADFSTPGSLRAYARFDSDRLGALEAAGETSSRTLLGSGILALTIDQGEHTQRYQGIVELAGTTFEEAVRRHALRPLGLERSTFLRAEVPHDLAASPHVGLPLVVPGASYPYTRRHAPSSTMHSNVDTESSFTALPKRAASSSMRLRISRSACSVFSSASRWFERARSTASASSSTVTDTSSSFCSCICSEQSRPPIVIHHSPLPITWISW